MDAISSLGEVIRSSGAHLPLDYPRKRIPDSCADALVKWMRWFPFSHCWKLPRVSVHG